MLTPVVIYGYKTSPITEEYSVMLNTWELIFSREAYGPVIEQGVWRIRTIQELRKCYKTLDVSG
jgi:hypothetical protein